jgi:hypothetical protein
MNIAGFDSAPSAIAWAYGEPGGVPMRGIHRLPDYGENTIRLKRYVREWGTTFLKSACVDRAYVEDIFVRRNGFSMPVFMKQVRVIYALEDAADEAGLDIDDGFWTVEVGLWRTEFYAGSRPTKGQASQSDAWKDMALVECARRNWLCMDHNIAEACGIWDYGCKHADKIYKVRAGLTKRRQQSAADERRRAGL